MTGHQGRQANAGPGGEGGGDAGGKREGAGDDEGMAWSGMPGFEGWEHFQEGPATDALSGIDIGPDDGGPAFDLLTESTDGGTPDVAVPGGGGAVGQGVLVLLDEGSTGVEAGFDLSDDESDLLADVVDDPDPRSAAPPRAPEPPSGPAPAKAGTAADAAAAPPEPSDEAPTVPRTYDELMIEGRRLLAAHQSEAALQAFRAAGSLRSGDTTAATWAELAEGIRVRELCPGAGPRRIPLLCASRDQVASLGVDPEMGLILCYVDGMTSCEELEALLPTIDRLALYDRLGQASARGLITFD